MARKDGSTLRAWYWFELGYGPRAGAYVGKGFVSAAEVATLTHSHVLPGRLVRLGRADVDRGRIGFTS
jgi:hypothetical protein